jgi:hypothetical protein
MVLRGNSSFIYVNGAQTAEGVNVMSSKTTNQSSNIYMGSDGSNTAIISVDEVKIYSRALSLAEIQNDIILTEPLL